MFLEIPLEAISINSLTWSTSNLILSPIVSSISFFNFPTIPNTAPITCCLALLTICSPNDFGFCTWDNVLPTPAGIKEDTLDFISPEVDEFLLLVEDSEDTLLGGVSDKFCAISSPGNCLDACAII